MVSNPKMLNSTTPKVTKPLNRKSSPKSDSRKPTKALAKSGTRKRSNVKRSSWSQESAVIQKSKPLREFRKYRQLPTELRLAIMELAAEPRDIEFTLDNWSGITAWEPADVHLDRHLIAKTPVPAWLQVNKESREHLLKKYIQFCFADGSVMSLGYFNPNIDALLFNVNKDLPGMARRIFSLFNPMADSPNKCHQLENLVKYADSQSLALVKHIRVCEAPFLHATGYLSTHVFPRFAGLKTVEVFGQTWHGMHREGSSEREMINKIFQEEVKGMSAKKVDWKAPKFTVGFPNDEPKALVEKPSVSRLRMPVYR